MGSLGGPRHFHSTDPKKGFPLKKQIKSTKKAQKKGH